MIAESSITRSIAALGFHLNEQMHKKQHEGHDSRLAETDQQFQIEVSGEAGETIVWTQKEVTFDHMIFKAVAQRQNPLGEPHFTYGYAMQSDSPVILHATVQRWLTDTTGNYTGAIIGIAVDGRSETPISFKANIHLTFQGLSAPVYPATGTGEG